MNTPWNWNLFLMYVAVGALSELLTMKRFSPGQRMAAGVQIVTGGFVAASIIPPTANNNVIIGLFIAATGRVLGGVLGNWIDKYRIWRDGRLDGNAAKGKRQDG